MRKLASIRTVTNIRPIEGKDLIEQVNVDGWNVIVKKGEFSEGNLCVYIEIDSKLPEKPEFEFLAKRKYIIKTMKMAGVRSEGIVFPLSILPKGKYVLGQDVTNKLKIVQYNLDPEEKATVLDLLFRRLMHYTWFKSFVLKYLRNSKISKKAAYSTFPSWISKTDEERIQNKTRIINAGYVWTATEKLDGSSATFGLRKVGNEFEYVVCSRNQLLTEPDNIWHRVSKEYGIEDVLKYLWKQVDAKESLVLQGEIIGPAIQGNKYNLKQIEFFVFNLIIDHVRWTVCDNDNMFEKLLFDLAVFFAETSKDYTQLKTVPIIHKQVILTNKSVDDILKMATFNTTVNPENKAPRLAEGLVFRTYDVYGCVVDSFKAVSPDFLIKNGE